MRVACARTIQINCLDKWQGLKPFNEFIREQICHLHYATFASPGGAYFCWVWSGCLSINYILNQKTPSRLKTN